MKTARSYSPQWRMEACLTPSTRVATAHSPCGATRWRPWLSKDTTLHGRRLRNGKWIRTDGWVIPLLRLLPDSYWLYRVSDHEMIRIVCNRRGERVCGTRPKKNRGPDLKKKRAIPMRSGPRTPRSVATDDVTTLLTQRTATSRSGCASPGATRPGAPGPS